MLNNYDNYNNIISKWNEIVQKEYNTRHQWVGKMIEWELCQKFKFDNINKWYMHYLVAILENEMHKIL